MSPASRTWLTGRTAGGACRVKTIRPSSAVPSSRRASSAASRADGLPPAGAAPSGPGNPDGGTTAAARAGSAPERRPSGRAAAVGRGRPRSAAGLRRTRHGRHGGQGAGGPSVGPVSAGGRTRPDGRRSVVPAQRARAGTTTPRPSRAEQPPGRQAAGGRRHDQQPAVGGTRAAGARTGRPGGGRRAAARVGRQARPSGHSTARPRRAARTERGRRSAEPERTTTAPPACLPLGYQTTKSSSHHSPSRRSRTHVAVVSTGLLARTACAVREGTC